jgi:hypothetical protein
MEKQEEEWNIDYKHVDLLEKKTRKVEKSSVGRDTSPNNCWFVRRP